MNWLLLRLVCACWLFALLGFVRAVWLLVRDVPLESITTVLGLFFATLILVNLVFKVVKKLELTT